MAAVREALLKRLRVNATSLSLLRNPKPSLNGLFALTFNAVHRRFSDDVMGSFLDKSEVTDRVVSVVKNFQKVDPSKGFWIAISLYRCPIMLGNRYFRKKKKRKMKR
ncbi:hypothetical protein PVK06_000803 [Gossypium arboreum]|uniref:Uncharacterized protein n=1 Tax=Gossypium arboreum TaxID=29729 RepID=A0ABR0QZD6_GOSAR|nr:hypothetical protein PVK06_000803 [Gossypium arboreum]